MRFIFFLKSPHRTRPTRPLTFTGHYGWGFLIDNNPFDFPTIAIKSRSVDMLPLNHNHIMDQTTAIIIGNIVCAPIYLLLIWILINILSCITCGCIKLYKKTNKSSREVVADSPPDMVVVDMYNLPTITVPEQAYGQTRNISADSLKTLVEIPAIQRYVATTPRGSYR